MWADVCVSVRAFCSSKPGGDFCMCACVCLCMHLISTYMFHFPFLFFSSMCNLKVIDMLKHIKSSCSATCFHFWIGVRLWTKSNASKHLILADKVWLLQWEGEDRLLWNTEVIAVQNEHCMDQTVRMFSWVLWSNRRDKAFRLWQHFVCLQLYSWLCSRLPPGGNDHISYLYIQVDI